MCNFADDTSPYACEMNMHTILEVLEEQSLQAVLWFTPNFLKLNCDKCHFLLGGNSEDWVHSIKVGCETILESENEEEKLLGVIIDKNLKFQSHITKLC